MENLDILLPELLNYPSDTAWLEFIHENCAPEILGRDICALANSAAMCNKANAYLILGVDDTTHEPIGIEYSFPGFKSKYPELKTWIKGHMSEWVDFEYRQVTIDNVYIGVIVIPASRDIPSAFDHDQYIRAENRTGKLSEFPEFQKKLWQNLLHTNFEFQTVRGSLSLSEALSMIEYSAYFQLTGIPQPSSEEAIAYCLRQDDILLCKDDNQYFITNLGAVLFAKRISNFPALSGKMMHIIRYKGDNRTYVLRDVSMNKGYVMCLDELMQTIHDLIHIKVLIDGASRDTGSEYPETILREAVINAMMHQDFTISGSGPVIEIFDSSIEITSPGTPSVNVMRILGGPPRCRNQKLADLMRRLKVCKASGTGWQKIALAAEEARIPVPIILNCTDKTRVEIFPRVPYTYLSVEEKLWSCYIHACSHYLRGSYLTNSSLSDHLSLPGVSYYNINRLIKDTAEKQWIRDSGTTAVNKPKKYIPFWG